MELLTNGTKWRLVQEDCIEHMAKMPAASVDFAVFSPPFPTLYAYTSQPEDIGNSEDFRGEAKIHLSFFYRQIARVLKPGRAMCVHVMQIPRLKRTGEVGLHDFRGLNARLGERAGLVYEYDWRIRKNPQAQAIRTHSHELQFAGLERDRARCRGTLDDCIIKFRAPGENAIPVIDDAGTVKQVTRTDWIEWAEGTWSDIKATDTLNVAEGRGEDDTKHICPLQLGLIRRLVKLYTNPGEIVFSPFAGIGSEGYEALKLGRRFYGCEIKDEYVAAAKKNLAKAERMQKQEARTLFGEHDVA
ncbi:MAG: site-specific DNA-methyltransferase [Patescibacteria group bacterium]